MRHIVQHAAEPIIDGDRPPWFSGTRSVSLFPPGDFDWFVPPRPDWFPHLSPVLDQVLAYGPTDNNRPTRYRFLLANTEQR